MKTFIDVEVLKIEKARSYQDKEPEHKSELVYLEKLQTEYGEEVKYKRIKSMLAIEEHKIGIGRFEVRVVAYLNSKTNRPELSFKILKQAK
jgi:hypothetical protein